MEADRSFFPVDVSNLRYGSFPETALKLPLQQKCSFLLRGFLYMLFIFTAEYMSGSLLKKHHCCPWDYSGTHFQINGVIRLDYAPLWFFCGLLFEYLNQKNGSTSS